MNGNAINESLFDSIFTHVVDLHDNQAIELRMTGDRSLSQGASVSCFLGVVDRHR